MRNAYIKSLTDLADNHEEILSLVADNGAIVFDEFRRKFPNRFINFGIAEANMVSVAAGLAACGKIPFAYTIGNFLTMRAFEQIRNDICLQKMNVKLVGIGSGLVYSDLGPTHHPTEDLALMRTLPGMTILTPADPLEAKKATEAAVRINGPVYLRLATGGTPALYDERVYEFSLGKGVTLRDGDDLTIIGHGTIIHEIVKATEELANNGISCRVINIHTLKPIDKDIILQAARQTGVILCVEEHSIEGGLGSVVASILLENLHQQVRFKRLGLDNVFACGYGSYADMKEMNGLSSRHIVDAATALAPSAKR